MPSNTYESARSTIDWPFEDHIPAIRCPITGMVISLGFAADQDPDEDAPLEPADGDCPTLLFRINYETGAEYLHPEFARKIAERKQALEALNGDECDLDELEIISEHMDDLGIAPLVIDMPTQGLMGDGVVIGLDLARAFPRA